MPKQPLKVDGQTYKTLVDYNLEASVLLLGSKSALNGMPFDSRLSDVDLLYIPSLQTFDDYVVFLKGILSLAQRLNKNTSDVVDVFMLSSNIANLHFSYLSVLAGAREVDTEYAILGTPTNVRAITSSDIFRTHLYIAKASNLLNEAQASLPVADTSQARKVTKELLRTLKVVICALNNSGVEIIEDKIMPLKKFSDLSQYLSGYTTKDIPHSALFQAVLEGKDIQDWPNWMIAQEEIAQWIWELDRHVIRRLDKINYRLCDGTVRVRDMLLLDLKDILLQNNQETRAEMIYRYADTAAGTLVKLSMAGVPNIKDLTSQNTPVHVTKAYEVIVSHLTTPNANIECLAAAVILLEYALEQTVHLGYDNNNLKK